MSRKLSVNNCNESGYSILEMLIVVAVVVILSAISIPYMYNYKKLYKSEDQALVVLDAMKEASQLALSRRRTMRLEIDQTDNAVLIIDENGAQPDTLLKKVFLEPVSELRMDTKPTGAVNPNPPNYADALYVTDPVGHQANGSSVSGHTVWAGRFRSDGTMVNAGDIPISATIHIWPPKTPGNAAARNIRELRAITVFGGSGAVRYWKFDGVKFLPY